MSTINVKRNVQFEPDLFKKAEHREWLDAVGKQLETKGVSIKLGVGANAKTVKNAAELQAAMKELKSQSSTAAAKAYITDLLQAIDDVVKSDAQTTVGDTFDFSKGSGAAKALGFDDSKPSNYAAATTEFGKAARTKPEGTMTIDAVTYQVTGAVPPPPPPPGGIDLTRIPHMSTQSLANAPVAYGRDGEEVEDTRVIGGLNTAETVALATAALDDLARPRAAVGLTLGVVPLDEMTWDSDSHALRRANPYVSFSLDSRSFELNPNSGQPRVGIGRDFFYDTFMAKKDLKTGVLTKDLQKADLMFRTRIRYGSDRDPFDGTRVLVGMKHGTSIDPDGTKHARKIDNRTDSANQAVFDTLTSIAQTGKIDQSWGWGAGDVAPAASAMYRVAVQKDITQDIGGSTGVLAMEPGAVARQIRARFHLDESSQRELLQGFNDAGEPKIKELVELITAAPDWAASGAAVSKAAVLAQGKALLDRSAIVTAATEGLQKIKPGVTVDKALIDSLWPGQQITTREQAKMQRAVADAIRSQYDAFAENIDLTQRNIGGNTERAVRDAGAATDVRDYLRQKSAVARFMAAAETASASGVVSGQPATYTAYAKKIIDMPAGKEKTDLLQRIGIGLNQLTTMNDASFSSVVKVDPAVGKRQTLGTYIAAYDEALKGPNKDAFVAELGSFLAEKNSRTLSGATAADKDNVLGDIRKNLVTAHAEILHRMVEGADAWGQAIWFNGYRETMLSIDPQGWNFVIGSMDYSEFYDAKTGGALTFAERVSRRPLDPARMTGAMISNDFQIELQAEEGYTAAIRRAQYGINGAAAGLMMDYAISKNVPGVTVGNAESFEKWFSAQAKLPAAQRKTFVDEVNAFARSKGSPIDVSKAIGSLEEQEQAIRMLAAFAKIKDPTLNTDDRSNVESYYRTQALTLTEEAMNTFLTEIARYAAAQKSDVALSPNLLRTLDFKPFAPTNVNQPVTAHATVLEDFTVSNEVWSMVKQSQRDLSAARGADVQRVLRDNNLRGKTWDPPTKAKGDYAIDYAIPN